MASSSSDVEASAASSASASVDLDATISQFMAFSGSADPAVARQYLEMSGNDLGTAVSLFMDHNGGGGGGGGVGGGGGIGGGMGSGGVGSSSSSGGIGGGSSGFGFGGGGGGDHEPRAPDATRSMRLLGGPDDDDVRGGGPRGMGGGGGGMNDPSAALMAAIGGPAAREMMERMMEAENNGAGGAMAAAGAMGMMDGAGGMASTWAAADAASSASAAAAVGGAAASAGASAAAGGGAGGDAGGPRGGGRRPRTGSGGGSARRQRRNRDDTDDSDGDHGDAMEEDDSHEYEYDSDEDDDDDDGDGGNRRPRAVAAPPSLTTMFAPPTHLVHRAGGFMGARNFARDARRWLLVNVQSEDDFACHALNRDVWRDELVENLVREGFILWQEMSHTNEGQTYVTRYKVHGYPHLAIIDPRTGSLLWRKEGWTQVNPLTAEQFVEIASDFCSRHSFDKLPMAARHAYANGVPLGGGGRSNEGGGGVGGSSKRPIDELTEEEQLQAAIRASMAENVDGDDDDDDDDDDVDVEVVDSGAGDGGGSDSAADGADDSKPSAFEREILVAEVGDEPPAGGGAARVQIRMPDGKRLVRRFAGDAPVMLIYAFVAQSNEEARGGRGFELKAKFPPQDLFASKDETLLGCGLNGEAINVIWK